MTAAIQTRFEAQLLVGVDDIDIAHREFLALCAQLARAKGVAFAQGFEQLSAHTRDHFAREEALMQSSAFPASAEHTADHQRVLGELERFGLRIASGSTTLARAWIRDHLPNWFELHVRSMDSALAAHLKRGQAS